MWPDKTAQRFIIGLMVMALFGGASIVLTFVVIPDANKDAIIQLIGGINALAGMVAGFYFQRFNQTKDDGQ